MPVGAVSRITSANMVIEFKPALYPRMRAAAYADYANDQNHVTVISLNGATTGTFTLTVNGKKSATIPASAALAFATINTALDDLWGAGTIVASGSAGGPFTLTAASELLNQFLVIEITDDLTTGAVVTQAITSQGSSWYRLDGEASDFSYSGSQESVDVTGISETARREASTVSAAKFDLTVYEALKDYRAVMTEGVEGYLRVFENGKLVGQRYFAWEVLLTDASSSFKQFEKVEISMSGKRQGAPVARVGSIWSGA